MGTVMESFGYGLAAIGLIAVFLFVSYGVKRLCRKYMKRSKEHDDK
ncbi:MAG: hypothetical protein ACOX8M_09425 [Marvinbryantia sp.]